MKIGEVSNIDVHPTIHCERCLIVTGNWIECPICEKETLLLENEELENQKNIVCSDCYSVFQLIEGKWYNHNTVLKRIK